MSTASGQTPNYGLPSYTAGDYGDLADVPIVLNEVTAAVDGVLKTATNDVGVQASAVVAGQSSMVFMLMGV